MSNTLVLVTEKDHLGKLVTLLDFDQTDLDTLVVGDRDLAEEVASIASAVSWIDTSGKPAEDYAKSVALTVEQAAPKAVVAVSTPGSRAACGRVAFTWQAPIISNAISVNVDGDNVHAEHLILENKVIETVEMPAPAIVLVDPISLQADEASKHEPVSIEAVDAEASNAVELLSIEPADKSALQDAQTVVAVGRGIANGTAFEKAQSLSDAIGAEIACSMPVYNELNLLPHERYVGISGKHIDPNLYIALGISGLPQHVMGVKNAKAIVVVNKDPKAFFFENADYGIVGDVEEIIPELERALSAVM